MAYINFKEENYKAERLLSKRKKNNQNLYNKIKSNHNLITTDRYNAKYSFNIISSRTIDTSSIENEDEFHSFQDETFICAHFINCKIYNIKFSDCNFYGCIFEKCDFLGGGTVFQNCNFIKQTIQKKPSLNVEDNFSCSFVKCNMYSKFNGCNISYCIFENSNFKDTNFEVSDMTHIIMRKCNYDNVKISDCDLSALKVLKPLMKDFMFADKYVSKLDDKSFFDKIQIKEKSKSEYEGIYRIYEDIANEFNNNNIKNNFGEYYYLCKKTQRKSLKIFPKISSTIYYLTCGYGERVMNSLYTSLVVMLIFAIIYMIFGVDFDGEVVRYITGEGLPNSIMDFIAQYSEALNLSISIFVGVGTSNAFPMYSSNIPFDIEMVIGVIMLGIGIATATRKLVR